MTRNIKFVFVLGMLVAALACEDQSIKPAPVDAAQSAPGANLRLTTRTITVNNMKSGTVSSTANLYYKINSGSWTLLTNVFASSSCVQRGTFNAQDGDVISVAVELASNSDCIPFWASATSTCVTTGTLYYGSRAGGSSYAYTVSGDATLSYTARAVGDTWWQCPG